MLAQLLSKQGIQASVVSSDAVAPGAIFGRNAANVTEAMIEAQTSDRTDPQLPLAAS